MTVNINPSSFRPELEPYVGQRLFVQGVLIDIQKPSKKTRNHYTLVFGSLYFPNEDIEIDHAVITVTKKFLRQCELNEQPIETFRPYGFTVAITKYTHNKWNKELQVITTAENYAIGDINVHRLEQLDELPLFPEKRCTSSGRQPLSLFLLNRINTIAENPASEIKKGELIHILYLLPNNGAREAYMDMYSYKIRQTKYTKTDIKNTLYRNTN